MAQPDKGSGVHTSLASQTHFRKCVCLCETMSRLGGRCETADQQNTVVKHMQVQLQEACARGTLKYAVPEWGN